MKIIPYNIYKIYKSSNFFKSKDELLNFKAPNIDYIIFLDSDDYWELNCIEECVPRMDGVEVVWFKEEALNQTGIYINNQSVFDRYNLKNIITNLEWIKIQINGDGFFQFVCFGMINFLFLKNIKLKFENMIVGEDRIFGILLFLKCRKIYMLNKVLYFYRIREKSTCNYTNMANDTPQYFLNLFKNGKNINRHIHIFSLIKMLLCLINYCKKNYENKASIEICRKVFIPLFYNEIYKNYLKCDKISLKEKYLFINIDSFWIKFCNKKTKFIFIKNKLFIYICIFCYTIIFRNKLPKIK